MPRMDLTGLGLLLGGIQPGYQRSTLTQQQIDDQALRLAQERAAYGMKYPSDIFSTGETVTPAGDMAGGLGRDILTGGDAGPAITGTQQAAAPDIPSSVLNAPPPGAAAPTPPVQTAMLQPTGTPSPAYNVGTRFTDPGIPGYATAFGGPMGYTDQLPARLPTVPTSAAVGGGGAAPPATAPSVSPTGAIGGAQPLGTPAAYRGPQGGAAGAGGGDLAGLQGYPRQVSLGQLFQRLKAANPGVPDSVVFNAAVKAEQSLTSQDRQLANYLLGMQRIGATERGQDITAETRRWVVQQQQQGAWTRATLRADTQTNIANMHIDAAAAKSSDQARAKLVATQYKVLVARRQQVEGRISYYRDVGGSNEDIAAAYKQRKEIEDQMISLWDKEAKRLGLPSPQEVISSAEQSVGQTSQAPPSSTPATTAPPSSGGGASAGGASGGSGSIIDYGPDGRPLS